MIDDRYRLEIEKEGVWKEVWEAVEKKKVGTGEEAKSMRRGFWIGGL